jgi:hypothetical protein
MSKGAVWAAGVGTALAAHKLRQYSKLSPDCQKCVEAYCLNDGDYLFRAYLRR